MRGVDPCRLVNALLGRPPLSWFVPRPRRWDWRCPVEVLTERLQAGLGFLVGLIPESGIPDRTVLDVGCGMGDRTVATVLAGAASATGVDNDLEKLALARSLRQRTGAHGAAFVLGSAFDLPFPDQHFDVVLLLDVIEHLEAPLTTLREIRRVLAPGGKALVTFPPFRSPWGAHLFEHVAIPWAHLICPEHRLLEYWRALHLERLSRGETWISGARGRSIMNARTITELWSLNGMTIRHFLDLLPAASLEPVAVHLHTPGGVAKPLLRSLVLREYLVTRFSAVVERSC